MLNNLRYKFDDTMMMSNKTQKVGIILINDGYHKQLMLLQAPSTLHMYIYISSVYGPFSDRVVLPLQNIPSSRVLMKNIEAEFLRSGALPGFNHMRGMPYQIVLNIRFWPELN